MAPDADSLVLSPLIEAKMDTIVTAISNGAKANGTKAVANKSSAGQLTSPWYEWQPYQRAPHPADAKKFLMPTELRELVAWAEVFVEKLGERALQEEGRHVSLDYTIDDLNDEVKRLNGIIAKRDAKIWELSAINAELYNNNVTLVGENKNLRKDIEVLNGKVDFWKKENDKRVLEIQQLQRDMAQLEDEKKEHLAKILELQGQLEKYMREHNADEEEMEAMKKAFEEWKELDRLADAQREALILELQDKFNIAQADLHKIKGDLKGALDELDRINNQLSLKEDIIEKLNKKLDEATQNLKDVEARLAKVSRELSMSNIEKRALQAELDALTRRQTELRVQLEEANATAAAATASALEAKEHAKGHFVTLQNIRKEGDWLRRPDDFDKHCEEFPLPEEEHA